MFSSKLDISDLRIWPSIGSFNFLSCIFCWFTDMVSLPYVFFCDFPDSYSSPQANVIHVSSSPSTKVYVLAKVNFTNERKHCESTT
jgi:hypothetical protein